MGLLLIESVNLGSGDCELGGELSDFGFVFAELDFVGFWWRSSLSKIFDFFIESLDFWVFDHDLIADEGGFSFVIDNFGLKGPDSFGSILNLCFQIFHFVDVSIDRPEAKLSEIFFEFFFVLLKDKFFLIESSDIFSQFLCLMSLVGLLEEDSVGSFGLFEFAFEFGNGGVELGGGRGGDKSGGCAGFVGPEELTLLDEVAVLFGESANLVGFGLSLIFEGANVIVEEVVLSLEVGHFF